MKGYALASLALVLYGSGGCGNAAPPASISIPTQPLGADAGSSSLGTTPPPAGLPPFASMPPRGVVGSKKAQKKHDPAWASCHASVKSPSKDLTKEVTRLAEACEKVTHLRALGAITRGTQAAGDLPQEYKLKADAKHCYRVFVAADAEIADIGVLIKDSSGDVAGEEAGTVLLQDGAVCFTANDEAKVVVTVGSGKGGFAFQVWSD